MKKLLPLFLLAACNVDESVTGYADGVWTLTEMNGAAVSTSVTLNLNEQKRISGQGPCNRYFADIKAPLPWFEVGPIGATRMACPDLNLETEYFNALSNATLAEVQGDTLLLSSEEKPLLIFKATPTEQSE